MSYERFAERLKALDSPGDAARRLANHIEEVCDRLKEVNSTQDAPDWFDQSSRFDIEEWEDALEQLDDAPGLLRKCVLGRREETAEEAESLAQTLDSAGGYIQTSTGKPAKDDDFDAGIEMARAVAQQIRGMGASQ
jgi:hypothetical protein